MTESWKDHWKIELGVSSDRPVGGKIMLNGQDLSTQVRSVKAELVAGEIATLTLEIMPGRCEIEGIGGVSLDTNLLREMRTRLETARLALRDIVKLDDSNLDAIRIAKSALQSTGFDATCVGDVYRQNDGLSTP